MHSVHRKWHLIQEACVVLHAAAQCTVMLQKKLTFNATTTDQMSQFPVKCPIRTDVYQLGTSHKDTNGIVV